jgi:small-conductance mechanosensitive channel
LLIPGVSLAQIAITALIIGVILAITYVVNFVFGKIVIRTLGKRNRSSAYEIGRIGGIVIWTVGVLSALPIVGASDVVVAVVLLLIGAFLIILTRDFTSNWFAGQMIRTIVPFRVGDWIRTAGSYGRVSRIESLYTILVTPENETVVIPNSKLTSDLIVDRTTSGSLKVPVEVEIDPTVGFGQLAKAVTDISNDLNEYLSSGSRTAEPEIYVVSQDSERARVRIVLRIDNPARELEVSSEFRKRIAALGLGPRNGTVKEARTGTTSRH